MYARKAASPRPLFVLVRLPPSRFALRRAKKAGRYIEVRLKPDTTSVYCFGSSILIFDSGSTLPSSAADPVG